MLTRIPERGYLLGESGGRDLGGCPQDGGRLEMAHIHFYRTFGRRARRASRRGASADESSPIGTPRLPVTRYYRLELLEFWPCLWVSARVPGVEPTNTVGEQEIRSAVLEFVVEAITAYRTGRPTPSLLPDARA